MNVENYTDIIIEQMIQLNKNIKIAAKEGHIDIVEQIIKYYGANNKALNNALISAAEGGHIDIVERMIELGANDFKIALLGAPRSNLQIMEIM